MSRYFHLGPLLVFAILSSVNTAGCLAAAEAHRTHFELPPEPLDKALRDFGIQSGYNISYEPALVAGLRAPAVSGDLVAADALALLLAGTRLSAVNINENTVQVVDQAAAQEDANQTRDKKDLEEITVTGTHIRGAPAASPVIELGREEIDRSGYTSIADLLLTVPENFGGGINPGSITATSQVNARYADNTAGASVPNLRGLGPGSTLTLIDGHRMASGLPGGGTDISSIPIDAIERIDIVTDSASSIYGSDAVAGVVNIILKQNYDGAKTSLSYGYAPDGGGAQKRASQLLGTSWGSGSAMLAFEHAQQDEVDARQRDFTSSAYESNSLLPETKSNSVTLSVRQQLGSSVSVYMDGLYIGRDASIYSSSPYFAATSVYPSSLHQYGITAGMDLDLMGDWKAKIFATDAEAATAEDIYELTTPSTPENSERFLGLMKNIEVNANGRIAELPSGIVRLALGAGYRRESFSDALGSNGGSLVDQGNGARSVGYEFGELSIPLLPHSDTVGMHFADLEISGRSEHYSDFGTETVPKIGLVYGPFDSLKLRSTWGKAFRAPNIFDIKETPNLYVIEIPSGSPTGLSPVLFRAGGNPALQPETATAFSLGADYLPEQVRDLSLSINAFDIKYRDRITQIANGFQALTDPFNAFFVTPSPSAAYAQSVYDEYLPGEFSNLTSSPFSAQSIAAIVDSRLVNVAKQTARGADVVIDYPIRLPVGKAEFFLNGTYLDLVQQNTPQSPTESLSGLAFYPPKFRARAGATWKTARIALTTTVNYLAHEMNTQVTPVAHVDSWTTVDMSLRYAPDLGGWLAALHVSLSVLNVLNKNPPFVSTLNNGINYDSSNVTPLGRFITLQLSKDW